VCQAWVGRLCGYLHIMPIIRQLWMWIGLAGAVFIMCIMLNSFGLAWASIAAKTWLMPAGMARFWLRGIIFPGFRES
jgi:hypothetical protein